MKYPKKRTKIWIVGGDSKIGCSLSRELKRKNLPFEKTSRKKKKGFFYLDLAKKIPIIPLHPQDSLILLAGVTNMAECEKNKKLCRKVNLESQKKLIDQARKKNCFLVYLSSSRVFSGKDKNPSESTVPKPFNLYGKLKYKTELYIKQNHPNSAILRITKAFDTQTLKQKKHILNNPIYKSTKILIAPISIKKVIQILVKIIKTKKAGVFHLSPKNAVSSYKFYRYFNKKTKIKNNPQTKRFWGDNPLLSMRNTIKILHVKQQNWQSMVA